MNKNLNFYFSKTQRLGKWGSLLVKHRLADKVSGGMTSSGGILIRAKLRDAMLLLGLFSLGQISNFSCAHLRTLHVDVVA